jgi:hypothetical protein
MDWKAEEKLKDARWADHSLEIHYAHNSGACVGCESCGACFSHKQQRTGQTRLS